MYCMDGVEIKAADRVTRDMLRQYGISEKEAWDRALLNSFGVKETQRMTMKVKYKEGVKPIVRAYDGEWFDLRAAKDYSLVKGDLLKIDLGVAIELPEGYEAIIRPRSSTAFEYGMLMACSGVIDHMYCGDEDWWNFGAYVIRSGQIKKNDRICQFRIQKQQPSVAELNIETVEHLGNRNRGGFGSTGRQ
jgi:dUTP pyrophosphatase